MRLISFIRGQAEGIGREDTMFKITIITMAIVFVIIVVVRFFEEMEKPEEEGKHRERIDRKHDS